MKGDTSMIKCPNCGSSAQVKQVWSNNYNEYTRNLVNEYTCGCGCQFTMLFVLTNLVIEKEGKN